LPKEGETNGKENGIYWVMDGKRIEKRRGCMSKFTDAAKRAVELYKEHTGISPLEAWQKAIAEFSTSYHVRKKTCPKNTFLGLCSDSFVTGIPPDEYVDSVERIYARKALEILRKNPSLANSPDKLWSEIGNGGKHRDAQTEIVTTLWKEGLIK
jgi:hypothetical protein